TADEPAPTPGAHLQGAQAVRSQRGPEPADQKIRPQADCLAVARAGAAERQTDVVLVGRLVGHPLIADATGEVVGEGFDLWCDLVPLRNDLLHRVAAPGRN